MLGLTLIEMLLALALLSVIITALYSTFFLTHRAMARAEGSLGRLREARAALDIMSREIESSFYEKSSAESGFTVQDRDIFGQQASRLSFTAFSPRLPGLSRVSYYLIEARDKGGGEGLLLMKELSSAFSSGPAYGMGGLQGLDMVEEVREFTVEVLGSDGRWGKTWSTTANGRLPTELKLTLTAGDITLTRHVSPKIGGRP